MNFAQMRSKLEWPSVLLLSLGILPSTTSLSAGLSARFPDLLRLTGPISPLKLGLPVLILHACLGFKDLPILVRRLVLAIFVVSSAATLIAGRRCGYPSLFLREWMVLLMGVISAISFYALPTAKKAWVLGSWAAIIYGSTLLDFISTPTTDWLFAHVFDPNTKNFDELEVGQTVLTGIFGRQSLGKLLAWCPWLLFWIDSALPRSRRRTLGLITLTVLSSAATLGTSQRGPFIAAICAWIAFGVYHHVKLGNRKFAGAAAGALLVSLALMPILVPKSLWEPRIRALIGKKDRVSLRGIRADDSRHLRFQMAKFAMQIIGREPLGYACIEEWEFTDGGVMANQSHSHNMFLQQYRDRGWLWGSLHTLLWELALLGAWLVASQGGAALFAGLVAIWVEGMFDHPWFVLNHSLLLSVYLMGGLILWNQNRHKLKPWRLDRTDSTNH